jgi:hypothetical protein
MDMSDAFDKAFIKPWLSLLEERLKKLCREIQFNIESWKL